MSEPDADSSPKPLEPQDGSTHSSPKDTRPSSPVASAPGTPPVGTQSASSTNGEDVATTPVAAVSGGVPSSTPAPVSPATVADITSPPPSPSHMRSPGSDYSNSSDWVTTDSSPSPNPTISPSPDSDADPHPRTYSGSSYSQPHTTRPPGEEQLYELSPSPSPWPESSNSDDSQRAPSYAAPPPGFLFTPAPTRPPPGTGLYIITSAPHPYTDPPIPVYPAPQLYPAPHPQGHPGPHPHAHPSHHLPPVYIHEAQPPPPPPPPPPLPPIPPLVPPPQAQVQAEAQAEAQYKQIYGLGHAQARSSQHLPPVYIHEAQPPPPPPVPPPGKNPQYDAPFGFYRSPGKDPTERPKPKFYPPSSKPLFVPTVRVVNSRSKRNEPRWWGAAQKQQQQKGQPQGQPQKQPQAREQPQPQGHPQFHGQPQHFIGFGQPRGGRPPKHQENPIKIIYHEPLPRSRSLQQFPAPTRLSPHLQAQAEAEAKARYKEIYGMGHAQAQTKAQAEAEAEARYKEIYGPGYSQLARQRDSEAQGQAAAYTQASARQWEHIYRPIPALQNTQAYTQNRPPQVLAPGQVPAYQIHGPRYGNGNGQSAGGGYHGQQGPPIAAMIPVTMIPITGEERRYQCNFLDCAQRFARKHDLNRHRRSHFPDRPFGCEKCGKRFARQDALKSHISLAAKCGGNDPKNPVEISSSPSPSPSPSPAPEQASASASATGNNPNGGLWHVPSSAIRNDSQTRRARSPSVEVISDTERNHRGRRSGRKRKRAQEPMIDGEDPDYDRDYRPPANIQNLNQAGSSSLQRQREPQNRWVIGTSVSANYVSGAETEAAAAAGQAAAEATSAATVASRQNRSHKGKQRELQNRWAVPTAGPGVSGATASASHGTAASASTPADAAEAATGAAVPDAGRGGDTGASSELISGAASGAGSR
ncbi:hypothetical protein B0T09DRAFT_310604 [Sordaria sp. MPI-SDFR-AT-0083]|nr:hypothetical protein B0T09DRAFT_310604 [Sordaria sp. MPI-SDFR-AT-0083]